MITLGSERVNNEIASLLFRGTIRALIGHLHVIGHLQSEIVILMINW